VIRSVVRASLATALASAALTLTPSAAEAGATQAPGDIVVSTLVITDASGDSMTTVYESTFNSRGDLLRDTVTVTDATGAVVSFQGQTTTFGLDGRRLSTTGVSDSDGDGPGAPWTITTTTSYDKSGFVTKIVATSDVESDGVIDSTTTTTFGRDRKSRTTSTTSTTDGVFGSMVQTVVQTTDARGNPVEETTINDYVDTSVPDTRTTTTSTYTNYRLDSTRTVAETLMPSEPSPAPSVSETSFDYDSTGNVVLITTIEDVDGVVGVDQTSTTSRTYNAKSQVLHEQVVTERSDGTTETRLTDNTYDTASRLTSTSTSTSVDGQLTSAETETYSFDGKGRLVDSVLSKDLDGDGGSDVVTTITTTFDAKGRQATYLVATRDGSGVLMSSSLMTYAYSKTTVTTTTTWDFNGDGSIDQTMVSTGPLR
jgi:hypothetical protein